MRVAKQTITVTIPKPGRVVRHSTSGSGKRGVQKRWQSPIEGMADPSYDGSATIPIIERQLCDYTPGYSDCSLDC